MHARVVSAVPIQDGRISHSISDSASKMDNHIEKQHGQNVIDSLSVLDAVVPTFHEELWPKFYELFPMIGLALHSRFAIIRQCAAKCFATICDVMTAASMRYVIETVVPFLGDTLNLCYRQGSTELVYRKYRSFDLRCTDLPFAQISCRSSTLKPCPT